MKTYKDYDWPGWSLKDNLYGEDFDFAARQRMIKGSEELKSSLKKYEKNLGKVILEVGPFFNPLILPEKGSSVKVFYWENDPHVVKWINEKKPQ